MRSLIIIKYLIFLVMMVILANENMTLMIVILVSVTFGVIYLGEKDK